MLYLTVSRTPSGLCPTPPNLVGDSLKCHFNICDPPGRAPLHLYPVVALRLPHGYPNYIFSDVIRIYWSFRLFFRQWLLHFGEDGEGAFHYGVDTGGNLGIGHVDFTTWRRLYSKLGDYAVRVGNLTG